MLDDLREQASDPKYYTEDDKETVEQKGYYNYTAKPKLFLGMTPIQRFVIAALLFLMAVVMGSIFLLVTEKVYFPFG